MRNIDSSAWLLVLLSAGLQILIFPLPNFYLLGWIALAPLLIGLLRARRPDTLQIRAGVKLLPARPLQGFLLGYLCGIVWYAGSCYWIYNVMHQYGGVSIPAAIGILFLFCLYLGLYHGFFGLLIALLAGERSFSKRALLLAPVAWVAVELARTRVTGFPWDLLGISQVDNIPLARIATVTGVYGISFEIMVVNVAFAAAFLLPRDPGADRKSQADRRAPLLIAALAATFVLQAGVLIKPEASIADHSAVLVQQNIPILQSSDWTTEYFQTSLRELTGLSLKPEAAPQTTSPLPPAQLIVWPESPAPFYTGDPTFRNAIDGMTHAANAWAVVGSIGVDNANMSPNHSTDIHNSGALVSPDGRWVGRYDKAHLVPFGEYLPFKSIFGFAGGLTKEVGDFTPGTSHQPLDADGLKLGVFICYESIFPDEVRQQAKAGAQFFVNISNDGWYGDSGAWAQHLRQARMRSVENNRWLLRDTNTGLTASIDPMGRVVASVPRKTRTSLLAPYALLTATTFYTRTGDWFAYLCAIILLAALITRLPFFKRQI